MTGLRSLLYLLALALVAGAFFVLPRAVAQGLLLLLVALAGLRGLWWLRANASRYRPMFNLIRLPQAYRRFGRIFIALGGVALLLLAWWLMLPTHSLTTAYDGLTVLLLALLLLGTAFYRSDVLITTSARLAAPEAPIRWRWVALGVIAVLVVLQAHFLLDNKKVILLSAHGQLLLLLGGWALIVAGLCGRLPHLPALKRPSRTVLLLLVILLLALGVRVYLLEEGVHRWVDEVNFLFAINALKANSSQPILMPFGGITAFSWLYPYTQWLWQALSGPSIAAVRMPSVLLGVAQVGALYFLMRQIASRRAALLAALLMATFPAAIHFSRLGLNNVADPVFGTLALAFLARAFQQGRRTDYVLAGAMLGLSHYFYEGGRLFYTLFVVCWCGWLFVAAHRPRRRGHHWWVGVLTLLLVAVPLYLVWAVNDKPFFPRLGQSGFYFFRLPEESTPLAILNRLRNFLLVYTYLPEGGTFYRNPTGLILPPLAGLFLAGMAACSWRLRTIGGSLLFWWTIGAAVAAMLVSRVIESPRFVVVLPALCAVMAVGADVVWGWLSTGERWVRWRHALLTVGVIVLALGQASWYLFDHMPHYYTLQFGQEMDNITGQPSRDMDDVAFRAVLLKAPVDVYVFAKGYLTTFGFGATNFYFDRTPDRQFYMRWDYTDQMDSVLMNSEANGAPKAFFLEPDDPQTLARLQARFDLSGPYDSPWSLPHNRQMALWVTDTTLLPTDWEISPVLIYHWMRKP